MSSQTSQQILKVASAVVMLVGLVVALAAHPATAGITNLLADLAFLPFDGAQAVDSASARLLAAISGGVMFGWGVLLWQLSAQVLPKDPALAASLIRTSIVAWFVLDSTFSVVAGAWFNAVMNLAFLALFLWPLAQMKKAARAAA